MVKPSISARNLASTIVKGISLLRLMKPGSVAFGVSGRFISMTRDSDLFNTICSLEKTFVGIVKNDPDHADRKSVCKCDTPIEIRKLSGGVDARRGRRAATV
jgi:hypothetical protein